MPPTEAKLRRQTGQSAIFIGAGEPAEADHIGSQYRREFAGLGHDCPSATTQIGTTARLKTDPFN